MKNLIKSNFDKKPSNKELTGIFENLKKPSNKELTGILKRFDQVRICMYYVKKDMENSVNKELAIEHLESIINRVEIINSICAEMLKDLKQSSQTSELEELTKNRE